MLGGQTVAQPHRQIEGLVVVHGFECSFHAHQSTITDGECPFLSDKLLGAKHPDTATICTNLAALYHRQGRPEQAELFCQRALAVCEQTLGPEHPLTANNLNN